MPLDLENKQSFDAVQVNSWLKLNSLSLPSLFFNYVLEVANNNKKRQPNTEMTVPPTLWLTLRASCVRNESSISLATLMTVISSFLSMPFFLPTAADADYSGNHFITFYTSSLEVTKVQIVFLYNLISFSSSQPWELLLTLCTIGVIKCTLLMNTKTNLKIKVLRTLTWTMS